MVFNDVDFRGGDYIVSIQAFCKNLITFYLILNISPVYDSSMFLGLTGLPEGLLSNRPLVRQSVFRYLRDCFKDFSNFGPWVYPRGSLVIALVRRSVGPSVFKYLRDRSLVSSNFLHEVSAP